MDNKYAGMTVNERLYESGLWDKFDEAVENKNIDDIKLILEQVGLTGLSVEPIIEALGLGERRGTLRKTMPLKSTNKQK